MKKAMYRPFEQYRIRPKLEICSRADFSTAPNFFTGMIGLLAAFIHPKEALYQARADHCELPSPIAGEIHLQ
jgi:hypothetical protein